MVPRFSLFSLLLCQTICFAEDARSVIQAARMSHTTEMIAAKNELDSSLRAAIKVTANAEDFSRLELLVAARRRFVDGGELPSQTVISTDSYVAKRKASASRVYAAYRAAIEVAAKNLELDEAKAIEVEMQSFIRDERSAIGLPPTTSDTAKKPSKPAPLAIPVPVKEDTASYLKDFTSRFVAELRTVHSLDTTAKQIQSHQAIVKKFDEEIRKHTLTLSFPIENVEERQLNDGVLSFYLHLDVPEEIADISFSNRLVGTNERLKREEALAIPKGAIYRVTGVGRLWLDDWSERSGAVRTRRMFTIPLAESDRFKNIDTLRGRYYGIYLQDLKSKIDK